MRSLAALTVAALLGSCSAEPAPAPEPTASATENTPRTLIPADLDLTTLGGRVSAVEVTDAAVGPQDGPFARAGSYVACEKDVPVCDPAKLPAGTVYTYVVTVMPVATSAKPQPTPNTTADDLIAAETPPELVRTLRPVPGFNGAVGFLRADAIAALGSEDALNVTLDRGHLVWSVAEGSSWAPGRRITIWWQSTGAPEQPSNSYRFERDGKQGDVQAAFPAADKAVDPVAGR